MFNLVSRFINKIRPSTDAERYTIGRFRRNDRTVTLVGTLVYFVERRGYFAIVADDGRKFYAFNHRQFPKILRDRLRAQFTLEIFSDVPNVYKCGESARLLAVETITDDRQPAVEVR